MVGAAVVRKLLLLTQAILRSGQAFSPTHPEDWSWPGPVGT